MRPFVTCVSGLLCLTRPLSERPFGMLILNLELGTVQRVDIVPEPPSPDEMEHILSQAIYEPPQGTRQRTHRPAHVEFEDTGLAAALEKRGIGVSHTPRPEVVDEVIHDLELHLRGKPEPPGLLSARGVTPELVGGFFAAAAEFYRAAPWVQLTDQQPLAVCVSPQRRPRCAHVMGAAGIEYGLAVPSCATICNRMARATTSRPRPPSPSPRTPARPACISNIRPAPSPASVARCIRASGLNWRTRSRPGRHASTGGQWRAPWRRLGERFGSPAQQRAQGMMYRAWEERNPGRRIILAHEALDISPDCADAYVLLAEEEADTLGRALDYYRQGVEAGERALGQAYFKRNAGHFWGLLETRPYMRARLGLANTLWEPGRKEEALPLISNVLLCPPRHAFAIALIIPLSTPGASSEKDLYEILCTRPGANGQGQIAYKA